jgi:hypothetical protein
MRHALQHSIRGRLAQIGKPRQSLTNCGNQQENPKQIDYDYKVRDEVLVINKGILRKAESAYGKEPWTITTVHTNGTIRIQCGTKMERLSFRRVEPFTDDIDCNCNVLPLRLDDLLNYSTLMLKFFTK